MLVSILVPIYNVEDYIEKCLETIFHQTYPNIEYIFLDDCSPDNSIKILNNLINKYKIDDNRFTIISHSANEGIAVTRNDLLNHASGDYILFIDSDDWIEYDMIEKMVNATNNGEIDIIGCDFTKDYKDGRRTYHYEAYENDCFKNLVKIINYGIGPTLWKVLVKRNLFNNIKFNSDIEIGEDYIASIKLFYYAKTFSAVHQYLYHYIQFNYSRYSNQIEKSISNHIQAVRIAESFLKEKGLYNTEISHEFNLRKFAIKSYYLMPSLLNYNKWKEIFPESNRMWRYVNYSPKEKFKFWLAEKHLYGFYLLFNKLFIKKQNALWKKKH